MLLLYRERCGEDEGEDPDAAAFIICDEGDGEPDPELEPKLGLGLEPGLLRTLSVLRYNECDEEGIEDDIGLLGLLFPVVIEIALVVEVEVLMAESG